MNIRDMLNPVIEGSDRLQLRRCTPSPELLQAPCQPNPPITHHITSYSREWVIIAHGGFPKGQPHQDNKFVRPNPPLYGDEEQVNYHIPFSPLPEVGPYEILDEHVIQSPMPERYINAKPDFPNSVLHEDALKVFEDTSYEKVVRVWVECEPADGNRRAVFMRLDHVRRLPRIEGWQVVKKSGGEVLTRYMIMLPPDATGQTPLRWEWMMMPEIRQQLPQQCSKLVHDYREYNPSLLQAEAEAAEGSPLKRQLESQPVREDQSEATPGDGSTTETDIEVSEVGSGVYGQPPSPKRQYMSPAASYRVAGVSAQASPAVGKPSPAPYLPRSNFETDFPDARGESSSNLSRMASKRSQRLPNPEPQLLGELKQRRPRAPRGSRNPTGPSFTPINFNPSMPAPGERDLSQLQPLSPQPPGLKPGRSFNINEDRVDIDDPVSPQTFVLNLFPVSQPECHALQAACANQTNALDAPKVGGLELGGRGQNLALDLDRAISPGQPRTPPHPHPLHTQPTSPPAPAISGIAITNFPLARHSPSSVPASADSPLSTLRPSPSPHVPSSALAPFIELAPQLESPVCNHRSPSPLPPPRGSVYPQLVADKRPVRRSARLGARGPVAVPEVLINPLTKEWLVKAKQKDAPVSEASSNPAPAKRGRIRSVTAAASELEPAQKRGRGRPKGGVGKQIV